MSALIDSYSPELRAKFHLEHGTGRKTFNSDLAESERERKLAIPNRHICGKCGAFKIGPLEETLAWFRDHAKAGCR